jgi:hypothetical protein
MESQQFDRLTRHLEQVLSRRRAGGALAGLGIAASLGFTGADAKKKKRKKKKKTTAAPTTLGPAPVPPGVGCTPDCAGKACGADDGCGNRCQSGTCPIGRICLNGSCSCTDDNQCSNERNPNGFECVGLPGPAVCGCHQDSGATYTRRVCVAGEPCSRCCADSECKTDLGEICTSLPLNTLLGRVCCLPHGAACGIGCCSGICGADGTCGCLASGRSCGSHEACCSNQCGTQTAPFTCA